MGEADDEFHSDVVYQVQTTKKGMGYIVFLFEHQSKPEEMMAFRTLEYSVFLMRQHLDQGHSQLPVVIPIVFYHGKESPYPYSTEIFDCFENPALAKQYYMRPFKLIDVTVIPDEELKKNIITAPLQIIMKHIRDKDLLPYFAYLAKEGILEENAHVGGGKLLINVVNYVIRNGEISDKEMFKELLLTHSGDARRPIMTIFEQHQQEKLEQFTVGAQKKQHEIASNLLREHIDIAVIAKTTHLSMEEIKKLKKEIENTKH